MVELAAMQVFSVTTEQQTPSDDGCVVVAIVELAVVVATVEPVIVVTVDVVLVGMGVLVVVVAIVVVTVGIIDVVVGGRGVGGTASSGQQPM